MQFQNYRATSLTALLDAFACECQIKKKLDATLAESKEETTGKRMSDENYSNKLINADDGTKMH